ncbi:MAG: endonuclease [Planctomycetes bacterium]|nr:endonuclease [Planctomycetota bacterium]
MRLPTTDRSQTDARRLRSVFVAAILWLPCLSVPTDGQIPTGYYDSALGLSGTALRDALHEIIDDHTVIPYDAVSFDVHDALEILDEDPLDSDNVILIYSGNSVAKSTWPDWNREHLWPVSLGSAEGTPAYSDLHHLFAADADVNSIRSNRYFDDCEVDCASPLEAPEVHYNFLQWEPPLSVKGDIARAAFYMTTRYRGDVGGEPQLELVDFDASTGCSCLAYLDTLLGWHQLDPVSAEEIARNDSIYDLIQGNRNPFVDHPEFVDAIWGSPQVDGVGWINEIHYDNNGADIDEGVEVAGPAGTNLLGWTVTAYNGNGFVAYDSVHLGGTIPDEGDGFGALWFDIPGLQNGSPDGVALVRWDSVVLEFLSYEGTIDALDGPAFGTTSTDIGVFESGAPIDETLQRTGMGTSGPDFVWVPPGPHSRGLLNAMQSFPPSAPDFVRGDCNVAGGVDIGDAIRALDFLFAGATVACLDSCDANHDGATDIADAITLLSLLFASGAPLDPPYPVCGPGGAGPAPLGCVSFDVCP